MATENKAPQPSLLKEFPLSFRFSVTFFIGGIIPNPLDIGFQKVSGLVSEVKTDTISEGGQNLYAHRLPTKVHYENLKLERGMVVGSLLNIEFNLAMATFKFKPGNALVTLFNEDTLPVSAWMFRGTYPVRWAISDLDANQDSIVIDSMELAYKQYISIRI